MPSQFWVIVMLPDPRLGECGRGRHTDVSPRAAEDQAGDDDVADDGARPVTSGMAAASPSGPRSVTSLALGGSGRIHGFFS